MQFDQKFYGASQGSVVVVGQFDQAEVCKAAGELVGAWPSPASYARSAPRPDTGQTRTRHLRPRSSSPWPIRTPITPRWYLPIFGGSTTSRAADRICNKEVLSYGVNSRFVHTGGGQRRQFRWRSGQKSKNTPNGRGQLCRRVIEDAFQAGLPPKKWRRQKKGQTYSISLASEERELRPELCLTANRYGL